jgi:hypothetical protein
MLIFMGRAALLVGGTAVEEGYPQVGDSLVNVEGAVDEDRLSAQIRVHCSCHDRHS